MKSGGLGTNLEMMAFSEMTLLNIDIYITLDHEESYSQIDHSNRNSDIKFLLINLRYYERLFPDNEIQLNLFNQINLEKILDSNENFIRRW